ncbi:MAG TPA: NADPH:quinone reductase [Ramlibacter sp.]|nr:NADPH:quinone reductase [Ramlibacter sp.]
MKAVWYERFGEAADVLTYGDMPEPQAGPGEVRVRLHASSVNPADTVLRRGMWQIKAPRIIPNSDGAGVVDQVGAGVTRFQPGDRVWLYNGQRNGRAHGTAAEYIAIDERLVTPLPPGLGFAEGATLGIPCMTAWVCLFMDGPIAGKTVLVTGGAGAVGHYAVQLARWGGARVIATVSSERKAEEARRAGADVTIAYTREDVAARVLALTDGRGAERIVEVDFGANLPASLQAIAVNGVIATYASTKDPVVPFDAIKGRNVTIHALRLPQMPRTICTAAQQDIVHWLVAGQRIHNVAGRYPLSATAAAHVAVEQGNKLGTVVVDCTEPA